MQNIRVSQRRAEVENWRAALHLHHCWQWELAGGHVASAKSAPGKTAGCL